MTTARTVRRVAALFAALSAAGCGGGVERKFVVESNVPNAQVYIDNRSVGAAPAYSLFEYYGYYTIRVVQPGYETVERREHVTAPWYAYPPFDLIAEVLPFRVRDTRRIHVELTEARQIRTDDILSHADALRERGQNLPPPERPAEPRVKGGSPRPPGPTLQPPVETAPGPNPPVPLPAPAPVPDLVPRVTP
jgi:hypothetical protein